MSPTEALKHFEAMETHSMRSSYNESLPAQSPDANEFFSRWDDSRSPTPTGAGGQEQYNT